MRDSREQHKGNADRGYLWSRRAVVRRLLPDQWKTYRDLRLRALQDSPDAFGGTFEQSVVRTDEQWQQRLADASPVDDLPLIAQVDTRPVGMAWGMVAPPASAQAHVYQMWVAPQARGAGAGRRLLAAITQWADTKGLDRLLLGVTCGNGHAEALYESAGFVAEGEPEPLRAGSELLMQNMVRACART